MVVQKPFGEILSAFTWMAQDLYINKIEKIRLLLPESSRMLKSLRRTILVLHSKRGKKGSTQAKLMVAIAYNKGVVMCEQYEGSISGSKFAKLCDNHFPQAFMLSANPHYKLFLQDGDPSQNSAKAMQVFENMGAEVFSTPLRSPDLNPIENFFHSNSVKINEDSLNVTHETFQEFSERVKSIIVNYPTLKINKIIDSMDKRINMIIEHKGQIIKC